MILADENLFLKTINDADCVVIGIGEEWSTSFEEMVKDDEMSTDLVKASSANCDDWALEFLKKKYYEKFHSDTLKVAYENLLKICKDKNYFLISLNYDSYPVLAGFSKDRCVFPCGNYEFLQCDNNCSDSYLDATEQYHVFLDCLNNNLEYKPLKCPFCNGKLSFNNLSAKKYCEGGYLDNWQKYMQFLQKSVNTNVCVIELGASTRFAGIIRNAFEKTAIYNKKAKMFRINESNTDILTELEDKCYVLKTNSVDYISNIFVS